MSAVHASHLWAPSLLMEILKRRRQQPLGILQGVPAAPPDYCWSANSSCGQLTAESEIYHDEINYSHVRAERYSDNPS